MLRSEAEEILRAEPECAAAKAVLAAYKSSASPIEKLCEMHGEFAKLPQL